MFNSNLNPHFEFLSLTGSGESSQSPSPSQDQVEELDAYSKTVTGVVVKVGPAVAHVHVSRRAGSRRGTHPRGESGSGSGVVITPDGYTVTNSHVVEGATSFRVVLADGSSYNAELVGKDTATDLAVLRVSESGLTIANLGDSESLRVGQLVIAIGNPLGFQNTVTAGVVRYFQFKQETGVQIVDVVPNSPAAAAGLKMGDILVSLNGSQIASIDDIHRSLSREMIGKRLQVTLLRDWTKKIEANVIPAENPE